MHMEPINNITVYQEFVGINASITSVQSLILSLKKEFLASFYAHVLIHIENECSVRAHLGLTCLQEESHQTDNKHDYTFLRQSDKIKLQVRGSSKSKNSQTLILRLKMAVNDVKGNHRDESQTCYIGLKLDGSKS